MAVVSMKDLLEAGVHFGHQTRRWNPKMKPYIFTERNGIYIVDLQRTLREIDAAYRFVRDLSSRGGHVLFIGTKKQAQEPISAEATRAGQPYVTQRWLGGMLTNWVTIRKRVARMAALEQMETDGTLAKLPKKEALKLRTELKKLGTNLSGIRSMTELPGAVFIVDTKRETIAVAEARRLRIPVIGLVDTNCDPDEVDFVIPGNDDAIRAVNLITRVIADAAVEGRVPTEPEQVPEAPAAPAAPAVPTDVIEPAAEPAEVLAAEPDAKVLEPNPEETEAARVEAEPDVEASASVGEDEAVEVKAETE